MINIVCWDLGCIFHERSIYWTVGFVRDVQLRSGCYVMLVKVEDDDARYRACNIIICSIEGCLQGGEKLNGELFRRLETLSEGFYFILRGCWSEILISKRGEMCCGVQSLSSSFFYLSLLFFIIFVFHDCCWPLVPESTLPCRSFISPVAELQLPRHNFVSVSHVTSAVQINSSVRCTVVGFSPCCKKIWFRKSFVVGLS